MLLVVIFVVTIILYFFLKQFQSKNGLDFFPEPPGNILLGHTTQISSTAHILDVVRTKYFCYGNTVKIRIGPSICPLVDGLLTQDYKLIELILSSNQISTKSLNYQYLKDWLGNGLLLSDGNYWKEHRKILTPAFHFEILKQFIEVFESAGNILVNKLKQNDAAISVDLPPLITLYTLDVICESAMDMKMNLQSGQNNHYLEGVRDMCRIVIERPLSPIKVTNTFYWLSTDYYKQKKALKILHSFTKNVIDSKKQAPVNNKTKKMAFLDLLLKYSRDENILNTQEIREEVDTFMFEGHDTTSSGICFALYCLADHPEVQEKVLQEQKRIFGDEKTPAVTYSNLQEMKYLENVLKETLRLYPPVPIIGRYTTKEMDFDGYTLPKNTNIALFIYFLHRNPKFFPEPETFRPERFENFSSMLPYCYIPFSAGPRNCIGQKFAMLEMKSAISKIVRHFEIKPTIPRHKVQLSVETVLKSVNGVKVVLKNRD